MLPDVATVTLTAQWTVNTYMQTFDANGGTGGKTVTQNYGTALTAPTVTRAGYTFKGWSPAVPAKVPAQNATYTVRFGVGMVMEHYLDESFDPAFPELVASIRSEEYYVRMMAAWYFATALAKQYDAILPYIEGHRLDDWTHNKAIQKSVESYRITPGQKEYLKTLKVKKSMAVSGGKR